MVNARRHPEPGNDPTPPSGTPGGAGSGHPSGPASGRLNLLLSYAGWESSCWVDHLPRLLEPMGVVSHRAGTGREATDVLTHTRIHIAIVDLGLPLDQSSAESPTEEAGSRLLELLSRQPEPPPTVVVKRSKSHREDLREMNAALRLGAFAVVDRPRKPADLNLMLDVLRRCLLRHYRGMWPA
ncbi:MAG: response regulator [Tepidisphaera sp.]